MDTHSALQNEPGATRGSSSSAGYLVVDARMKSTLIKSSHSTTCLNLGGHWISSLQAAVSHQHTCQEQADSVSREGVMCSATHRPFMLVMICAKATATLSLYVKLGRGVVAPGRVQSSQFSEREWTTAPTLRQLDRGAHRKWLESLR